VVANTLVAAVVAGVVGTIAMDLLNLLFARPGMILKIDVAMIGRMAAGWARGRFRYGHPAEMAPIANERLLGFVAHYAIGIGLAIPFVFFAEHLAGSLVQPIWALPYGIATTVASWFLVYPSMGLGMCGWRSPEGAKAITSPLANHTFYGVGLVAGFFLMMYS